MTHVTALQAAEARLSRAGRAWRLCGETKYAVRHFLNIGFSAPEFRARYGRLFNEFDGHDIEYCIKAVELAYLTEKRERERSAKLWGRPIGSRMTISVLREMRLMLRVLRFEGMAGTFHVLCDQVTSFWRAAAAAQLSAAE